MASAGQLLICPDGVKRQVCGAYGTPDFARLPECSTPESAVRLIVNSYSFPYAERFYYVDREEPCTFDPVRERTVFGGGQGSPYWCWFSPEGMSAADIWNQTQIPRDVPLPGGGVARVIEQAGQAGDHSILMSARRASGRLTLSATAIVNFRAYERVVELVGGTVYFIRVVCCTPPFPDPLTIPYIYESARCYWGRSPWGVVHPADATEPEIVALLDEASVTGAGSVVFALTIYRDFSDAEMRDLYNAVLSALDTDPYTFDIGQSVSYAGFDGHQCLRSGLTYKPYLDFTPQSWLTFEQPQRTTGASFTLDGNVRVCSNYSYGYRPPDPERNCSDEGIDDDPDVRCSTQTRRVLNLQIGTAAYITP